MTDQTGDTTQADTSVITEQGSPEAAPVPESSTPGLDIISSTESPVPSPSVTAPVTITTVTATPIERETLAKELKEFAESVGHDAYLVWEWLVKRV